MGSETSDTGAEELSHGRLHKTPYALCLAQKTIVIDNSSAFRLDPKVPLIIPEINLNMLAKHHYIIASPNCSVSIMLMALFPLHRYIPIQRIQAATRNTRP